MIKDAIEGHLQVIEGGQQKGKGQESWMTGPHNLKPERVVKALERAGWAARGKEAAT